MSGLYQILINGTHRQTAFAYNDKDALEIALRWFNNEPTQRIRIAAAEPNENGSHLQTHIEE